ncbi:hypothetical protein FA13DRAFT_1176657 [Coprinellus micaceus]|uniref:Uncharacterized protein n=1 Tax=Coprinellus micaceus TaxID=71717 RepID=A0A4Y7SUG1_COPMI|nr:hypothetical protein FA13DRAFT_1176657 [Coprinellus micaceus]
MPPAPCRFEYHHWTSSFLHFSSKRHPRPPRYVDGCQPKIRDKKFQGKLGGYKRKRRKGRGVNAVTRTQERGRSGRCLRIRQIDERGFGSGDSWAGILTPSTRLKAPADLRFRFPWLPWVGGKGDGEGTALDELEFEWVEGKVCGVDGGSCDSWTEGMNWRHEGIFRRGGGEVPIEERAARGLKIEVSWSVKGWLVRWHEGSRKDVGERMMEYEE